MNRGPCGPDRPESDDPSFTIIVISHLLGTFQGDDLSVFSYTRVLSHLALSASENIEAKSPLYSSGSKKRNWALLLTPGSGEESELVPTDPESHVAFSFSTPFRRSLTAWTFFRTVG
ncbi:hypothetical protein DTO271D3_1115 [Paecilomyces variotii]|nr:hypothetical protein DTO271D3_1115 [Paecilomyces variotii]